MIFNNLVGYTGEAASSTTIHPILACRLMNKYWKTVAEKIVEPATISALEVQFCGLPRSEQKRRETIISLIPTMYLASNPQQGHFGPLEELWCPNLLKNSGLNPFPSKALLISGDGQTRTFPTSHFSQMPVLKMISGWRLGHNLTSFILEGFRMAPYILMLLLQQMPNLKILKISDGFVVMNVGDEGLETDKFQLAPLDKLEVLKVANNYITIAFQNQSADFISGGNLWIINSYVGSTTLTQLEIDDEENKIDISIQNFPNLKKLKLNWMKLGVFESSQSLPLEHLSIERMDASDTTFEKFAGFLNNFASTLVHLEIIGLSMDQLKLEEFDFRRQVTPVFPNLKFFSWRYPLNEKAMLALALYFLPKLPALEKLELTGFRYSTEVVNDDDPEVDDPDDVPLPEGDKKEIKDFLERENYWAICSKLESIHVFHRRAFEKEPIYEGYRKLEGQIKVKINKEATDGDQA